MAKNSIPDFSATASSNTDIQSVDIDENCAASGINNAIRELMADLADVNDGTVALTSPQMGSLNVTGNVGIGTNFPSNPLHVFKSSAGTIAEFRSDDGTNNPRFSIYGDSSGTHLHHTWSSGASNLIFEVGGSAGSNEKVRIDTSGNVVLNNAAYLQFKDSGGTARDVLAIDAFNGLNINSAGGGSAAPIVFKENGSEVARFDSSGNLLVGTTSLGLYDNTTGGGLEVVTSSNGAELGVANTASCAYFNRMGSDGDTVKFFNRGVTVGTVQTTSSSTSYNTSSDHRLKENVTDITGATDRLKQLNPVRFNFIADADTTVDGFLAHEVQTVVPEAITGTHNEVDDDGNPVYQGIDQSKLVPLLVATIQELEARIAALEAN